MIFRAVRRDVRGGAVRDTGSTSFFTDRGRTMSVMHILWYLPILLMPFFLGMILDTSAWKQLLPNRQDISFRTLFAAHVGTESLFLTLPAGFAVADAMKIVLLRKETGVQPLESFTSLLARRWMIGVAQVLFLAVAACGAAGLILKGANVLLPSLSLTWMTVAIVGLTAITIGGSAYFLLRDRVAEGAFRLMRALAPSFIRPRLDRHRSSFQKADACFQAISAGRKTVLFVVVLLLLSTWTTEALESFLVAQILGIHLTVAQVLMVEALLSIATLAAFFLPAGVGVKDVGYVALFNAIGIVVGAPQIALFVGTKRLINVIWIAIGFVVLLASGVRLSNIRAAANRTAMELS